MRPVPAAVVVLAVALLAGCGSAPTAPPAPPVPAPTPPPGSGTGTTSFGAGSAVPVQGEGAASWTMPDLVGAGLQEAQDAIQGLTDFGIVLTTSHDASGQGRAQVSDRNWRVCDQSVPPGATITPDTMIDFGAVKLDETC